MKIGRMFGFISYDRGGDGKNLTLEVINRANVPDNGMTFSLWTLAFAGLVLLHLGKTAPF